MDGAPTSLYDIMVGATELNLLTDEQIQFFIMHGYLILSTDLPQSFHEDIFKRTKDMQPETVARPGNNILPVLPELLVSSLTPSPPKSSLSRQLRESLKGCV